MEYIPPFQVSAHSDNRPREPFSNIYSFLLSQICFPTKAFKSDPPHRYLYLVYKQPGPIVMLEGQQGCTEDRAMARIMDKDMLATKY